MWRPLTFAWAVVLPGAARAGCPYGGPSLREAAREIQSAWVRHDTGAVRSAAGGVHPPPGIPLCATTLSPTDAAEVHLSRALVGFLDKQPERASRELSAARRAVPVWTPPAELAPPGGLVATGLAGPPPTSGAPVRLRRGLLVDGTPSRSVDPALPALVQRDVGPGRVVETWSVDGDVPTTLRPLSARPGAWWGVGAGLLAVSVPALVVGERARQQFRQTPDAASAARLEHLNRLTVSVGWTSLATGLAATGVGVVLR